MIYTLSEEEKKLRHRAAQKAYKKSKKGKSAQWRYNHSEAKRQSALRYYYRSAENKKIMYSHTLVWLALKKGQLVRLPCEVCGKPKTHGHHDDYSKPLEVRWLCSVHHAEQHNKQKSRG